MSPTKLAALNALTHIVNGMEPARAADQAVEVAPDEVLALLWRRVRNALEEGAYSYLEGYPRGTGVHGVGHDLAEGWFPVADRRGERNVEEDSELVGPMIRDWFFHRAVALKVVA